MLAGANITQPIHNPSHTFYEWSDDGDDEDDDDENCRRGKILFHWHGHTVPLECMPLNQQYC